MSECRSPELQDLLPDYVAEALDGDVMARVRDHVAACAACADDLGVLQLVRQVRPRVAVPDIARIVAALPEAPGDERVGFTGPRLVRDEHPAHLPAQPRTMRRTRPGGSVLGISVWRVAATLGVVIAGGASVLVARRGVVETQGSLEIRSVTPTESSTMVASARAGTDTPLVSSPVSSVHSVSVSYGDLGDYSAAELESMIERLDQWDGVTNTEPLPGVPILPNAGGGAP